MEVYRVGKVQNCQWDEFNVRRVARRMRFCYVWDDLEKAISWALSLREIAPGEYDLTIYRIHTDNMYRIKVTEVYKGEDLIHEEVELVVDEKPRREIKREGVYRYETTILEGQAIVFLKDIRGVERLFTMD